MNWHPRLFYTVYAIIYIIYIIYTSSNARWRAEGRTETENYNKIKSNLKFERKHKHKSV